MGASVAIVTMAMADHGESAYMALPQTQTINPASDAPFLVTVPPNAPEGSVLSVQAPNGTTCQVQVPPQMVPGSQFMAAMPPAQHTTSVVVHGNCGFFHGPGSHLTHPVTQDADPEALTGRMRDRCCEDQCAHFPLWLHSFFCTSCMIGQIWEKLIGPRGKCCQISACIICVSFVPYVGGILVWMLTLIVLCQIVPVFARRYQIPEHEQPNGCSIACCAPCVLSQMARHMEDYEAHPEKNVLCECFSPTLDYPHTNYLWGQQPVVCVQNVHAPVVMQTAAPPVSPLPVPPSAPPPPAPPPPVPPPPAPPSAGDRLPAYDPDLSGSKPDMN